MSGEKEMIRVYVAGKLRDNAIDYLEHVREMCIEANKVQGAGFLVYVPCWDLIQCLVIGSLNFTQLFNNSYGWLEVCDAVYVVKSHYKSSKGTQKEIAKAKQDLY